MECRPSQNNETEIKENCIHQDEEEVDQDGRFLSREELEENQKVQEMLLKFLNAKSANKSELRKSLFNIAASLMKFLAILEDTPNQETTDCRAKNRANPECNKNDKFSSKDQNIPKKINQHLGPKNDGKDEQIPRVTIKRVSSNNKPGYIAHIDRSLHENEERRINLQKPDSVSSQYKGISRVNTTKTFLQKDEICNTRLNNETEIVFECKNVEPTITSFATQKLDYLSRNQLQDSEIGEAIRATIKDERLHMVKKEYLDDNIEKVNLNNECETNGENEIIPPVNVVHDNEESEKLETCSKKLEKNSNRKVHQDTSYDQRTHSCKICGKKFTKKSKLESHTDVVHNGRKLYQCDKCPKEFSSKGGLVFHISTVHNGITYTCDVCAKTFTRKDNLRLHINTVHMNNGKLFKCDECQKSFSYKCQLTAHIENGHKGIAHPCDLCEKVFTTKTGLYYHKNSKHQGITFTCDICAKTFTRKDNLRLHINTVHMNNGKLYQCDTCRKTFGRKDYLNRHINSVHDGITHTCDSCGKTYKSKSNLKNHIDFVHKNLKHRNGVHNGINYTCDICEKIFTQKGHLMVHINVVHMGNRKLYKCDECQKSFNYKSHLTCHINTVHKGIIHPCDLCEKRYKSKKNLKLHRDSMHKSIS